MPDEQNVLALMDRMIAGEVPLSEDQYRLVVLTALRDLRSKYSVLADGLNGEHGLIKRVEELETRVPADLPQVVAQWKSLSRRLDQVAPALVVAFILSFLTFIWAILTHQVVITLP